MRNDLNKVRGWAQVLATEENAETKTTHLNRIETIVDEWETMVEQVKQLRQLTDSAMGDQSVVATQSVVDNLKAWSHETELDVTIESTVAEPADVRVSETVEDAITRLVSVAAGRSAAEDSTTEVTMTKTTDDWVEITVFVTESALTAAETAVLATGEETELLHAQGVAVWLIRTMIGESGGGITAKTADGTTNVQFKIPIRQPPELSRQ